MSAAKKYTMDDFEFRSMRSPKSEKDYAPLYRLLGAKNWIWPNENGKPAVRPSSSIAILAAQEYVFAKLNPPVQAACPYAEFQTKERREFYDKRAKDYAETALVKSRKAGPLIIANKSGRTIRKIGFGK